MPEFIPDVPIRTIEPRVVVEPGLRPGRYRFRLVVSNAAGDRSQPSEWIVSIEKPSAPIGSGRFTPPRFPVLNRLARLIRRPRDRFPT